MLVFSEQYRIVSNIVTSFEAGYKTGRGFSFKELEKAKLHLQSSRYETTPKSDFTFIVMWLCYQGSTGIAKTLRKLQELTTEDIKEIYQQRDRILRYQNTFSDELKLIKNTTDPFKLRLSPLGMYYLFKKETPRSRILQKKKKRVEVFMEYFPTIKEYLDGFLQMAS